MSVVTASPKKAVSVIIGISILAIAFLFWLIYFKEPSAQTLSFIGRLPAVNASLNALSAICLVCGFFFIKRNNRVAHQRFMVAALVFSALFLVSYLVYHNFQGDTPFLGTGMIRPVYFFILITHIVLSVFALPLALITVFFASQASFKTHRKIARYTFPIWLYVSVTGVLVFFLLKNFG